jgi:hypothetical protein
LLRFRVTIVSMEPQQFVLCIVQLNVTDRNIKVLSLYTSELNMCSICIVFELHMSLSKM